MTSSWMLSRGIATLLFVGLLGSASPSLAVVRRIGPERQLNAFVIGDQALAGLLPLKGHGLASFFVSPFDLQNRLLILARRFSNDAVGIGPELRVTQSSSPPDNQINAVPIKLVDESILVVLESHDGDDLGVLAQRMDSTATSVDFLFQVNSKSPFAQLHADAAAVGSGAVVVWSDLGSPTAPEVRVYARLLDNLGEPVTNQFEVGTNADGLPLEPVVAGQPDGSFVVAWYELGVDLDDDAILARRFQNDGTPYGPSFVVNTFQQGPQRHPAIATLANGDLLVAWDGFGSDPDGAGVYAQRFSAAAEPIGTEFQVNSFTSGHQLSPSVAPTPDGGFLIYWVSEEQDGSDDGVYAKPYRSDGSAHGEEFQVSLIAAGDQRTGKGSVVFTESDTFVFGWSDLSGRDTFGAGVFAQVFHWLPNESIPLCGDGGPVDLALTATDALSVLMVSVDLRECERCRCDVDGSGIVSARDALAVLRASTFSTALTCPLCSPDSATPEQLPRNRHTPSRFHQPSELPRGSERRVR